MASIFISYSTKHRGLTERLVSVLEDQYGQGSVWWDHALESRSSYQQQIRAALDEARVVIVIWTAGAIISDYVYAEAVRAQETGKLVNVRPADISFREIPEPFNIHHIDDLDDNQGVLATIASVMQGAPLKTRVPLHEIFFRQHGHRVLETKQRPSAEPTRVISPTELLQAKFEIVPFIDANNTRNEMIVWCTGDPRPAAGRLLHGPGGLGKTRMMIDLAAALRTQGWVAGFLERPHDWPDIVVKQRDQAVDQLIAEQDLKGLLFVVDYAEGRQDEVKRLANRIAHRPRAHTTPVRLVLLTRSAGDWWSDFLDENADVRMLFHRDAGVADVVALKMIETPEQRLALFRASVSALGRRLSEQGHVISGGEPPMELLLRVETGIGYARPIAIQMEALLFLTSASTGGPAASIEILLRGVLGLERDHWRKLAGIEASDRKRDMSRAVAQTTALAGIASKRQAEHLFMLDAFYKGRRVSRVDVASVLSDVVIVYGRNDETIGHLEPDLIGEHHVATIGDIELIDGCAAWIGEQPEAQRATHRRNLLTTLQRATQPEHGDKATLQAESLLRRLIVAHTTDFAPDVIAVMIETPGELQEILRDAIVDFTLEQVEAFDSSVTDNHVRLLELGLTLSKQRVRLAVELADRAGPPQPIVDAQTLDLNKLPHIRLFDALYQLSLRHKALNQHTESLQCAGKTVELIEALSPPDTIPHVTRFVGAKMHYGQELADAGKVEQAREQILASTKIAWEYAHELNRGWDTLAIMLMNFAQFISQTGSIEEAVQIYQNAITAGRVAAQSNLNRDLAALCAMLSNIGMLLDKLGRKDEAHDHSEEAVAIARELAQREPDVYLSQLGTTLHNHGNKLEASKQLEEAVACFSEAANIRRGLAELQPSIYAPLLIGSLTNIRIYTQKLERLDEAMAASLEIVNWYRKLAPSDPDQFMTKLATAMRAHAHVQAQRGDKEVSARFADAAAGIWRNRARSHGEEGLVEFIRCLELAAATAVIREDFSKAEALAREGLIILAPLMQTKPGQMKEWAEYMLAQYSRAVSGQSKEPDMRVVTPVIASLMALEKKQKEGK